MANKRKVEIVWGIRNREGLLIPMLTSWQRRTAIWDCCRLFSERNRPLRTWSSLRKQGFTVHKLEVRDAR